MIGKCLQVSIFFCLFFETQITILVSLFLFELLWKYWILLLIFQMNLWFMGTICKLFCLFKSYKQWCIFDFFHSLFQLCLADPFGDWNLPWFKLVLWLGLKLFNPGFPQALDFLNCFGVSTALYQFVSSKLIER